MPKPGSALGGCSDIKKARVVQQQMHASFSRGTAPGWPTGHHQATSAVDILYAHTRGTSNRLWRPVGHSTRVASGMAPDLTAKRRCLATARAEATTSLKLVKERLTCLCRPCFSSAACCWCCSDSAEAGSLCVGVPGRHGGANRTGGRHRRHRPRRRGSEAGWWIRPRVATGVEFSGGSTAHRWSPGGKHGA